MQNTGLQRNLLSWRITFDAFTVVVNNVCCVDKLIKDRSTVERTNSHCFKRIVTEFSRCSKMKYLLYRETTFESLHLRDDERVDQLINHFGERRMNEEFSSTKFNCSKNYYYHKHRYHYWQTRVANVFRLISQRYRSETSRLWLFNERRPSFVISKNKMYHVECRPDSDNVEFIFGELSALRGTTRNFINPVEGTS